VLPHLPSAWLARRARQPLVWRLGGCAAPHPGHAKSRGQGEALHWSVLLAPGLSAEEIPMRTGRLHLAVLPGLILLSLSLAERCDGSAGWVFTESQLRASAGDSVLLQCLFLDPVAKGWTVDKVDWLRMAGAGKQKVGRDPGAGGGAGRGAGGRGGRARQPCCSREAAGKPGCMAQALRGGSFPCVAVGNLHRSPQLRTAGEPQRWVLHQGLSEGVGASWALACGKHSTGRERGSEGS